MGQKQRMQQYFKLFEVELRVSTKVLEAEVIVHRDCQNRSR